MRNIVSVALPAGALFLLMNCSSICVAQVSSVNSLAPNTQPNASEHSASASGPELLGAASSVQTSSSPFSSGRNAFTPSFRNVQPSNALSWTSSSMNSSRTIDQNVSAMAVAGWQGTRPSAVPGNPASSVIQASTFLELGDGRYATNFPDSVTGNGGISPAFSSSVSGLGFSPAAPGGGFPDMTQVRFLNPQLHVVRRGGHGASEHAGIYQRFENRLKAQSSMPHPLKVLGKPVPHQSLFAREQNNLKAGTLTSFDK